MAKITVAQAVTLLEERADDTLPEIGSGSGSIGEKWVNYINRRAYDVLVEVDPDQFATKDTITVVSGTSSYALSGLSSTFWSIRPRNCGLFETDEDGNITTKQRVRTQEGSTRTGYILTNTALILTPEPTKNESLILKYIPKLTDITGANDTIFDTEFEEYVENAMYALYTAWGDQVQEPAQDQRFIRAFDDLIDRFRQTPNTYDYGDLSVYY